MAAGATILVLDGHTLNPGDLSWDDLHALGQCEIHPTTQSQDLLERAAGVPVLLTNKTLLDAGSLEALPALRYVGVLATGHDVVDVAAAASRGVVVSNVPAYGTPSVAQHTLALLLELTGHTALHGEAAASGRWSASGQFSYFERPMRELSGSTIGIVGLGRIGAAVARIAQGLQMQVLAVSSKAQAPAGIELVDLDELFDRADVVTLHCPLNDHTRRLVNAERLARMKPGAYLINTARGGLVDEAALAAALQSGRLAGAGLDVLSAEPPPADHPLLHNERCLVTPHLAWATAASRQRLMDMAVDNVRAFLAGTPQNVVS